MVRKIPDAAIFTKDPDEVLDFRVNWANVMGADVDTIATGSFTADAGITKDSEVMTTTYMDVWLSVPLIESPPYNSYISSSIIIAEERG